VIAVDLHVHTCHSFDATTLPDELVGACARASIDCVAITDHGTIEGALRMRDDGRLRVIVGQETRTTHGELIGLFLREAVPGRLSPMETIGCIKGQGGLVVIPHPLLRGPYPRNRSVGSGQLKEFVPSSQARKRNPLLTAEVLGQADIIEVINARSPFRSTWAAVEQLCDAVGLPRSAGSDAHTPGELGAAYVEMDDFDDAESFLRALAGGHLYGRRSSMLVHVASTLQKLRKKRC